MNIIDRLKISKLRTLFILVALLIEMNGKCQNGIIKGKVINATDGTPIENATIYSANSIIRTATRIDGVFELPINKQSNDQTNKFLISSIGFNDQIVTIDTSRFEIIKLIPKTYRINEITIKSNNIPQTNERNVWLENGKLSKYHFSPMYFETQFAILIPSFDYVGYLVKSISFETHYIDKDNPRLLIRLYSCRTDSTLPLSELCEPIQLNRIKRKSKVEINLTKQKIIVPKNGFFIVFESLSSVTDDSHEYEKTYRDKDYRGYPANIQLRTTTTYRWGAQSIGLTRKLDPIGNWRPNRNRENIIYVKAHYQRR